ncbi:MAG TPA: hypothetical protein VK712_01525 [Verrucomicrobiae bacterium]|jgi:hypothetical protein|nr:hypothetical protein [Verrucomicrobiae bacterium]
MDASPSSNETAGLSLPPPIAAEQLATPSSGLEAGPPSVEQLPAKPERAPTKAQTAPVAVPAIPLPLPPAIPLAQTVQDDSASAAQSSVPAALDDPDLIEKEWVTKAKQIVERTKDDPHQQSEELTMFKADYIKQRYGKTIKLSK